MIAIVKYNAGNVKSVRNALHRLGCDSMLTDDPGILRSADKVIFPGVGEASTAMHYLRSRGLDDVLTSLHQPFLGICLGLQLMCAHSEEGDTRCLSIFPESVRKFPPQKIVPHMGWNSINFGSHPLFKDIESGADMYFVHSYHAENAEDTIATTNYITEFSSALARENYYAVQFHPEKSAEAGEQLLKNFLSL